MTEEEALTSAIKRAFEKGYLPILNEFPLWNVHKSDYLLQRYLLCIPSPELGQKLHIGIYEVVFSHDFAKAFWGEEIVLRPDLNKAQYIKNYVADTKGMYTLDQKEHIAEQDFEYFRKSGKAKPVWMFYIQEMAIAPDAVRYIASFIKS